VAPQFSRNCGQKLRKVQKSAEKCALLRIQIAERFEENSTAVVYGGKCRCAPIYIFSIRRYIAQTASVKFHMGSPKTARNKQRCAHQKEVNFPIFLEQLYTG